MNKDNPKIGVIDASTFGTSIADMLACKYPVSLGVNPQFKYKGHSLLEQMLSTRTNLMFIPDYRLSDNIDIRPIADVAKSSDIIIAVIPSKYLRQSLEGWASLVKPEACICSAIKGIELDTFMRPTKVIRSVMEKYGKRDLEDKSRYAVISGPTFSYSLREKKRLSASIAANDRKVARWLKDLLSVEHRLNLHISHDVKGTEYLGSLKNVIAIGGGYLAEKGYCDDEFDTYMTFATNEIANMLNLFGCDSRTILSLAGIGDLNMTSRSSKSRNFRAGAELARTGIIQYQSKAGVAEGYNTSQAIYELFSDNNKLKYADKYFRIFMGIYKAVHTQKSPAEVQELFDDMLSYYESGKPFETVPIIKSVKDRQMKRLIHKKYD